MCKKWLVRSDTCLLCAKRFLCSVTLPFLLFRACLSSTGTSVVNSVIKAQASLIGWYTMIGIAH